MITISPQCITDEDKIKFLYRTIELLRLEHNKEAKRCRDGEITREQWWDYVTTSFRPRNTKLFVILNPIKEKQGLFKSENEEYPESHSKWAWKEEGKKEIKWDSEIDLTKI